MIFLYFVAESNLKFTLDLKKWILKFPNFRNLIHDGPENNKMAAKNSERAPPELGMR